MSPILVPLAAPALPVVAEVDKTAYAHPWTLRHFEDSLTAGHWMRLLVAEPGPAQPPGPTLPDGRRLIAYIVAMPGVDEVHLLNITTVPDQQRQGWAVRLLQALADWARERGAATVWLEVRASNAPARRLYERWGFEAVGLRRGYYPDGAGRREDAVVMRWGVPPTGHTTPQDLCT